MAKSKIDWNKLDPTKHNVNWKKLSPRVKYAILHRNKLEYDAKWKAQNKDKQRLYVARSTAKRFIRKDARPDELRHIIQAAKHRLVLLHK